MPNFKTLPAAFSRGRHAPWRGIGAQRAPALPTRVTILHVYFLLHFRKPIRVEIDLEKDGCAASITASTKQPLLIEDAQMDERFSHFPAIKNTSNLIFSIYF